MAQLRWITLCGKIKIVEKWITSVDKKELENLAKEEPQNELILEYRNKIEEELKI